MDIENQIKDIGTTQHLSAGTQLFTFDDPCEHYVLVLGGQVRVELSSITGQQLILYRIFPGESCVLTTSCLLCGNNYSAQAITDTNVDLALLPKRTFTEMLSDSADFRQFVFDGFSARLSSMLQRTSELATYTIDQRLASALLARCELERENILHITHEEIAVEIGTAREVVTRRLGTFERDGLIKRHRGHLEITDEHLLKQRLAQQ